MLDMESEAPNYSYVIFCTTYIRTKEDEYIFECFNREIWIEYNQRVTGNFIDELDLNLDMISGYDIIASNVKKAFGLHLGLVKKHSALNDINALNIYQIRYLLIIIDEKSNG